MVKGVRVEEGATINDQYFSAHNANEETRQDPPSCPHLPPYSAAPKRSQRS